jgi:site-specific DNA recombinase
MKIIGYCRTSTSNQDKAGTIKLQVAEIESYADKNKYELVHIFKDSGVSGAIERRKGLAELYDFLNTNNEVDAIVIFKLDRLSRELRIQENLLHDFKTKMNVEVLSIKEVDLDSSDPTRVLMRQILGSFAQYEKSMITMRMKLGRIRKAQNGFAGGGVSFGYRSANKQLVVDSEQAVVIKRIYHMKQYKRMSFCAIARHLEKEGVQTANGGRWHPETIKRILKKKRLYKKGVLRYGNITSQNLELALV